MPQHQPENTPTRTCQEEPAHQPHQDNPDDQEEYLETRADKVRSFIQKLQKGHLGHHSTLHLLSTALPAPEHQRLQELLLLEQMHTDQIQETLALMQTGLATATAEIHQFAALPTPMARQATVAMLTACRQELIPQLTPRRDQACPDRDSQLYNATLRLQSQHGDPGTWKQLQDQVQSLLDHPHHNPREGNPPRGDQGTPFQGNNGQEAPRRTTRHPALSLDWPPGPDCNGHTGEDLAQRARFYLNHPDPHLRLTPWQFAARSLNHWAHWLQVLLPPGRMSNSDSLLQDFSDRHILHINPPASTPWPTFSWTHPAPDAAQHLLVTTKRLLHQAVRTLATPLTPGRSPEPKALQQAYRRASELLQHAQETLQQGMPDNTFPTASLRHQPAGWQTLLPFYLAPIDPGQRHPGLLALTTGLTDPAPLADHAMAQLKHLRSTLAEESLSPEDHRLSLAKQAAHDLQTAHRGLARMRAQGTPGTSRQDHWRRIEHRLLHADFLLGILHNTGAPNTQHPFPHTIGEDWLVRRHIPEQVHSAQDLDRQRTARDKFIKNFGFPIITGAAVSLIARYSPLLEVGAGSGYLAHELQRQQADVHPTDPGHPNPLYPWPTQDHWTDIEPIDARTAVATHPNRTLLISWPDYGQNWAQEALRDFQGEHVILIGEGRTGCTGTPELNDLLDDLFVQTDGLQLPQFQHIHDRVTVHRRRSPATRSTKNAQHDTR